MNALLICNGEPPSKSLCRKSAGQSDLIIAADGGANIARRCGIRPHCIIGDLDSITQSTRRAFRTVPTFRVASQESTDLEKGLSYLQRAGATSITILAATGKRLDFTLGNLASFWRFSRSMQIVFAGDGWTARPARKRTSMRARRGTVVSLIPFGTCSGVTLAGLRYPLRGATLRNGEIAVSNVVMRSPFSVSVRRGNLLLIILER